MRNGNRAIHLIIIVDVIEQTCLRIEEVVVVLLGKVGLNELAVPFIRETVHTNLHMTILQVNVCRQSFCELPAQLTIHISVNLLRVVIVVVPVRKVLANIVLNPEQLTEVITVIAIPTATDISRNTLVVVIVGRSHKAVEVVIHPFLVDEIRSLYLLALFAEEITCIQTELLQLRITFVLLIVTHALRIVKSYEQIPSVTQLLVQEQLIVLLMIEVLLVIIVFHVAILIVVQTT